MAANCSSYHGYHPKDLLLLLCMGYMYVIWKDSFLSMLHEVLVLVIIYLLH